jgi:prefoldin subunit 5
MLSISFLFERNLNDPLQYAKSPVEDARSYVHERLINLRKRIGKSGTNLKELQQQIKDYQQKNKYNNSMGQTQW